MKTALPPGIDHNKQVKRVADFVEGAANDAIENHTGPRPAGPKKVMNSELQTKTLHRTVAK